jgi:hypothetical protein
MFGDSHAKYTMQPGQYSEFTNFQHVSTIVPFYSKSLLGETEHSN